MGYTGPATSDQFKSMSTQTITGNGSATSFSLNSPVANSSEIRFVVNNVVQKPDVDYSATGTTLSTGSNVLQSKFMIFKSMCFTKQIHKFEDTYNGNIWKIFRTYKYEMYEENIRINKYS